MSENTLIDRLPKIGDRVHVEFDATVTSGYAEDGWINVKIDDADPYRPIVRVDKVAVIVEPVKVGDVATLDVLNALPPLSAVISQAGLVAQRRGQRWYTPGSGDGLHASTISHWPATVIHIGGTR